MLGAGIFLKLANGDRLHDVMWRDGPRCRRLASSALTRYSKKIVKWLSFVAHLSSVLVVEQ